MNTTIYYFSGTGNSLTVARKVASLIEGTTLIPIASLKDTRDDITAPQGRVGIICPIYDFAIPVIVRDFIKRLRVDQNSYLFAVLTFGGSGGAALRMINTVLRRNTGRVLNAGFLVKMPGNFPPLSHPPKGEKLNAILASADGEIEHICNRIRDRVDQPVGLYPISSLLQPLLYGRFSRNVHSLDEKFSISDDCTSCGICVSVCPVGNIEVSGEKPVFHHTCELCCACLNYCPTQAIDLNMLFGTKGRGRYHHPDVAVPDIKLQKEYRV